MRLIVGKYTNTMDVVRKTYKSGGALAFFKGFWPSTLSIFLFTGIDLTTYEYIKLYWYPDRPDLANQTWHINLVSSLCSCTVGVTVCYPISTIITRLQVNDGTFKLIRLSHSYCAVKPSKMTKKLTLFASSD